MEGTEDSMDKMDLIARSIPVDPSDINSQIEMNTYSSPPYTNEDTPFFGFKGLKVVYRVCRPDEDIENGIFHKQPCSFQQLSRSIAQHVASGSRYPSSYISTTASLEVASLWAYYKMEEDDRPPRKTPHSIVIIPLEPLEGTIVEAGCANLTNVTVREHFVKGYTHRSWAKSSEEVIFTDCIPKFRSFDRPVTFWRKIYPGEIGYWIPSHNLLNVYWLIKPRIPLPPPPKKKKQQNLDALCSTFNKVTIANID